MQLLLILAVVAAISISENAPNEPVADGGVRLAVALALMALVALFAVASALTTSLGLRRELQHRRRWLRRFARLRLVHTALWASVTVGILYWLGWTQLVRFNWQLDGTFLADDVLILLPVVLPMVLSWAAFYEVDRAVDRAVERGGLVVADHASRTSSRLRYVGLHVRHYLGLILLPVLVLLGLQDAAALAAPGLSEGEQAWVVSLPLLVALFVCFPVLVRYVWRTEPLPSGPLRRRLETLADRHGVRTRDILIWHTDDRVVNAAVTGFVPHVRYVFLTDALVRRFTDEEIEAVFAHEVGHIRHHHLLLRAMALIAPLIFFFSLAEGSPASDSPYSAWLSNLGVTVSVEAAGLGLIGIALYAFFVFGRYSRLLERQADLFACRTREPGNDADGTASFVAALEKLGAIGGGGRNLSSWLHPSIAERVAFLTSVTGDSTAERRYHAKMRWLRLLVVGALLVAVVVCGMIG